MSRWYINRAHDVRGFLDTILTRRPTTAITTQNEDESDEAFALRTSKAQIAIDTQCIIDLTELLRETIGYAEGLQDAVPRHRYSAAVSTLHACAEGLDRDAKVLGRVAHDPRSAIKLVAYLLRRHADTSQLAESQTDYCPPF